jgi:glucose/mannose-6-phosphate isomerase
MLDDLKYIHSKDPEDALGIALKQAEQYKHDFGFTWQPPRPVNNIIIAGMGGSGLAARALRSWPNPAIPLEVNQDYQLPSYVNQNSLVIVSSYTGNTEEEISILEELLAADQPEDKKAMIIVQTSGGQLKELATQNNLPTIDLPPGYQPRATFGYQFRALCEVLEAIGLVSGVRETLNQVGDWLGSKFQNWEPTVPAKDNYAKRLAQDLVGKSIVVYAGPKLAPAAYKWKISFNENAKNVAWYNQYSEFNHNEFIGWSSHPVDKPYAIVDLRSSLEHPQIMKRFELSERLLSGRRPSPEIIKPEGDDLLQQLVWLIALGDFVSIYVALLNGIDPTPVNLIEELKKQLKSE